MRRAFIAFLLASAIAGCGSSPLYTRPDLPLPSAWQAPSAVGAASASTTAWWSSFKDPELQRLLALALRNSPDLRIAVDRMRVAGSGVTIARAADFPSLSFDAGPTDPVITRLARGHGGSSADDAHYELGFNASYELDFWGRVSASVDAARFDYQTSAFDVDTVRIALMSSVARAYFDLRQSEEMQALAARQAALADQRVQLLSLRLDAGRIAASPLTDARLAAQEAQAQTADLALQRQLALQELATLLGHTAESLQLPPGNLRETLDAPVPAAGLPSDLLERRADIRAAEAHLNAAQAQVVVARAARLPQVQLTAQFGFLTAAVAHIARTGSALIGVGPGLSLPLFDGGRGAAEVELRRQQYDIALADYQKAVLAAFRDVEKALLQFQSASESNARWITAQQLQNVEIEHLQSKLDAGCADRLQLIEAQDRALQFERSALQAHRQHLDSMVALYEALGGDWTTARMQHDADPPFALNAADVESATTATTANSVDSVTP